MPKPIDRQTTENTIQKTENSRQTRQTEYTTEASITETVIGSEGENAPKGGQPPD